MEKSKVDRYTCVGCGFCCIKTLCAAALRLYGGGVKKCPQLIWNEENKRYFCGLMILPGTLGENYRKELYAGAGCCCNMNSWRQDVKRRDENIIETNNVAISPIFQAFLKAYGAEPFISDTQTYLVLSTFEQNLKGMGYNDKEADSILSLTKYWLKEHKTSQFKGFV